MRISALFASVFLVSAPGLAIPVTEVSALPAADRAQISALEQSFFDGYEKNGMLATVQREYKALGQQDLVTEELVATFRKIDTACGVLASVQRFKTENSGSRVVRDHFVIVQGSCILKWNLTYIRVGNTWGFNAFDVKTYDGNDWVF